MILRTISQYSNVIVSDLRAIVLGNLNDYVTKIMTTSSLTELRAVIRRTSNESPITIAEPISQYEMSFGTDLNVSRGLICSTSYMLGMLAQNFQVDGMLLSK